LSVNVNVRYKSSKTATITLHADSSGRRTVPRGSSSARREAPSTMKRWPPRSRIAVDQPSTRRPPPRRDLGALGAGLIFPRTLRALLLRPRPTRSRKNRRCALSPPRPPRCSAVVRHQPAARDFVANGPDRRRADPCSRPPPPAVDEGLYCAEAAPAGPGCRVVKAGAKGCAARADLGGASRSFHTDFPPARHRHARGPAPAKKKKKKRTGENFDWTCCAPAVEGWPEILSGGLTPADVGRDPASRAPYAVDVAQRVEADPGRKKPGQAVEAFLPAARAGSPRGG